MRILICCIAAFFGVVRAELTKEAASKIVSETFEGMAAKRELKMREVKGGFQYFEIKAA